jgi:exodeoxyribonuclease VII small subunit
MAKKETTENISWEQAYDELNEIVASLEDESVSVDLLAEKMKRASALIEICSSRLRTTEDAVNRIIREMDEPGPVRPEEDQNVPF